MGGCPQRHPRSRGQSQVTELSSFIHNTSICGHSRSFCVDDLSVFEASLRGRYPVTPLYLRRGARPEVAWLGAAERGSGWRSGPCCSPEAPHRAARTDPESPALDAEETARGGGQVLERREGHRGPSPAPPGVLRKVAGDGTCPCMQGGKAAASPALTTKDGLGDVPCGGRSPLAGSTALSHWPSWPHAAAEVPKRAGADRRQDL